MLYCDKKENLLTGEVYLTLKTTIDNVRLELTMSRQKSVMKQYLKGKQINHFSIRGDGSRLACTCTVVPRIN